MASANACASSGGTSNALMPCRANSRHPGTSVATIGRAQAAASNKLFGNPSRRDGRTAMCADAQNFKISLTCPSTSIPGRFFQLSISTAGIDAGLAASASPPTRRLIASPRRIRISCASINERMPLSSSKRPINPTVIGPSGSGSGCRTSVSNSRARDKKYLGGIDTQGGHLFAIIGVLNQHRRVLAFQQRTQEHRERRTENARLRTR